MKKCLRVMLLLLSAVWAGLAYGVEVTPAEMADAGQFMAARFDEKAFAEPVFGFVCNGRPSKEFLKDWTFKSQTVSLDEFRRQITFTYTDPATKLEARCKAVQWLNFPVVEWTVYLANTSDVNSPMIENLRAIDTRFNLSEKDSIVLHHNRGDDCSINSFAVKQSNLPVGGQLKFAPAGGRPTNGEWPYYNFAMADKGFLLAVGWPGQWSSQFSRDAIGLHLDAGQETTHFVLRPGEEVRTPLILMMFYQGDWIRGQNLWRQWMIRHTMPKDHGKQIKLPFFAACSSHQFAEMTQANEQSQKDFIDGYLKRGLKLDYWWMDAGWYVGGREKGWYAAAGTWQVDRAADRFPNGLRPISDYAHSQDVDIIVWFEPERVHAGTWLAENHPEWVLGGKNGGVLNLGHPEAWNWLVNHIDKIITEEGIDLYRQDYNIDPLGHWRGGDTPDRQGITENHYVTGYLAYWDELQKRHPGMLIDSCASGGRRNDLETMRRAVPLLRSDYIFEPVGNQAESYGLSLWLPFYGTGYSAPGSYNSYDRRSNMCPANIGCFDVRAELDDKQIMKLYKEWVEAAPHYYGDFYPLTQWNVSESDWIAWQFNRTDTKSGVVFAFRRGQCYFRGAEFKLRGLEPDAQYRVENTDTNQPVTKTGKELMEKGLAVEIPDRPGAAIVKYIQL
jgi:alpha-galactosidase